MPLRKLFTRSGRSSRIRARSGDDSFGTSIRILIRWLDQSVAALLNQLFRVPWFARNAFDFAASERRHMDRMEHAPHPFNVFFQVQPGLAQLNLDRPVADTVEVAYAHSLLL